MFALALAVGLCLSATQVSQSPRDSTSLQDVYVSGEGGYHTYRIPSIVRAQDGELLAFAEGRKGSSSDTGDIDLLLKRSLDGGVTWSAAQVIWDDGANVCGNPCAVVDRKTGTVWLLATWNSGSIHESKIEAGIGRDSRRVFVTSSSDGGLSWAPMTEITAAVKDAAWSWYATGPGAGIQLREGEHAGRLVIPCDHKQPGPEGTDYYSHVVMSDDHGKTWRLGGRSPEPQVNECEVVELHGGRLLLNMRSYDRKQRVRQVCFSDDGGESWTGQRHEPALPDPICQASLRRLRLPAGGEPGVLIFSNAASESKRERMTLRASFDEGLTWPEARLLYAGSSAYSCLVALGPDTMGCLFEADGYGRIVFARVGW